MKNRPFVAKCWLFLFIIFFTGVLAKAQGQETNFRRFSLTLSGGISLGNTDEGIRFMASSFNVRTEPSPMFGAGLQYALTPAWSVEAGYGYRQIMGDVIEFETTMHLITLKNIINLNQLLFVNRVSKKVNPFLTAGIGYDFFSYDAPAQQLDADNTSYNIGAGVAVNISRTFDLFAHYDYHMGSNSLDNTEAGFGSDLINTVSGGIRINFGKKKAIHPSWRPVPVDITPSDYELFKSQVDRNNKLETRVTTIEQELGEKGSRLEDRIERLAQQQNAEIDSLTGRVQQLEDRVTKLEETIPKVIINKETGLVETLPAGHYIQIFATLNYKNAKEVRDKAFAILADHFDIEKDKMLLTRRKQFFEISIGVFWAFNRAEEILDVFQEIHPDAFVITYPRPVSLQSDFKGMGTIDK